MKHAVAIIDPDIRINQQIVLGFSEELQRHDDWDIQVLNPVTSPFRTLKRSLQAIAPDAVAVRDFDSPLSEHLESLSVPLVIVAVEGPAKSKTAVVIPDSAAMGAMAAEYLLRQEFEHFAVVGYAPPHCPDSRIDVFCSTILRNHAPVEIRRFALKLSGDHPFGDYGDPRALLHWLHELPKPCAIFAHSDQPGAYLIRTCVRNGIRVPEDVSVLGVDDDPLYCRTVTPNLASVHIPNTRIGIEAARMILDWKPGRRLLEVAPTTVVERASCRSPRRDDPLVDKALAYLRKEVAKGVRVRDLQELTGLTPHQLIYRFNLATGHTPIELILHHRISVAKQLLAESTIPVATVARQSGFNSAPQFYVTFHKQTGLSPSGYRAKLLA